MPAEIVDLIGGMAIAVIFIVFLTQVPKIFHELFTLLALQNPKNVAKDLAGLISISAAATGNITILYNTSMFNIKYDVQLADRIINVTMIRDDIKNGPESEYFAVDGINKQINNKAEFEIVKVRAGQTDIFDIRGLK